jgi:diacylglycerol kinase (ATP)
MKKLIRSFGYAFKGMDYAAATQLNFRIHLVATLAAVILGIALKISVNQWLWIGACIALVLAAELMNSALEVLTDLVSPEYNVKAGRVKDMGAAAVLIIAFFFIDCRADSFCP